MKLPELLQERLERVLELGERLLGELVEGDAEASLFETHRAFRWDPMRGRGLGRLVAIEKPAGFDLDDLLGVDGVIASFVRNTEQFLLGLPFNHVLLYGDRGTGKSSAVRGVLTRFGDRGLRLIEVEKEELVHLPRVLDAIRGGGQKFRFLIFCDDLSFGANEAGYREMKAVLDGSIAGPPENVCLIVTSNRRHLVSQSMADNREARLDEDNELHLGEVLEEKLALADRFGLALGFYCFDQATYLAIVESYLRKEMADPLTDEVRAEALRFALRRGSRSGRTARQFVNQWAGERKLLTR
ncbi:MAG: ATP-binding protein [Deltaproteobacteria bacterium]|nr:ATP-binding protein [Deltaproteobacteria bacterium]